MHFHVESLTVKALVTVVVVGFFWRGGERLGDAAFDRFLPPSANHHSTVAGLRTDEGSVAPSAQLSTFRDRWPMLPDATEQAPLKGMQTATYQVADGRDNNGKLDQYMSSYSDEKPLYDFHQLAPVSGPSSEDDRDPGSKMSGVNEPSGQASDDPNPKQEPVGQLRSRRHHRSGYDDGHRTVIVFDDYSWDGVTQSRNS